VPDVSEVASIGGMVQQYQVVLDPDKLRAYGITQATVAQDNSVVNTGNTNDAANFTCVNDEK